MTSDNKAVIGFRGVFAAPGETEGSEAAVLDLYAYVAVRLDMITSVAPRQETRHETTILT